VNLDEALATTRRDLARSFALPREVTTPSLPPSEPRHPDVEVDPVGVEGTPETIEEQAQEALAAPTGLKPAQEDQNPSRRRRQATQTSRTVEDDAGSVRKPRATTLLVPEEKRCEALTTRGARCKAPRLRGLRVCMFHGHLAADDERLQALADPEGVSPPLSPRRALKAVAALRAGEMAVKAVDGALTASERDGGAALLRVVDAVDPQREETATLHLTADSVGTLSFADLTLAVRSLVEGGHKATSGLTTDPLAAS